MCWKWVLVALAVVFATPACAGRVALVVGNDAYRNIPPLQKAVADARAYAALLRDKGYAVDEGYDLDFRGFNGKLAAFVAKIQPGDDAVFVYSGHGWSDGAQNYLVGVDAPATASEDELSAETTPLRNGVNGVLDRMEKRGAHLRVAIVDACRDNPFAPPGGRGFGQSRGLAPMAAAPAGTFVVFSASAGQSAMDRLSAADPEPNSVFTREFLPQLRADLSLQDAVKATQARVVALSATAGGDQKPSYVDEVIGQACLSASCRAADSPAAPPTPAPPPDPCLALVDIDAAPAEVAKRDIDAGLRACAERVAAHPEDDRFTSRLRAAQEQRVLRTVLTAKSKEAAQAYLVLYPNGRYAGFVQERLTALSPPPPPAPRPTPAPATPIPDPTARAEASSYSYPTGLDARGDNFLALRNAPSAAGALISRLGPDALFTELRRADGWTEVRLIDGATGWVNSHYVGCCRAAPTAQASARPPAATPPASCDELWYRRNAIYKAGGYCFRTPRGIAAFGNAGCRYFEEADTPLTPQQRDLLATIRQQERESGCRR